MKRYDVYSRFARRHLGTRVERAGLEVLDVRRCGIWREIVARPARGETHTPGLTSRESGR